MPDIALIKNNAMVGSKIAKELSYIRRKKSKRHQVNPLDQSPECGRPVVIGGSNVDLVSSVKSDQIVVRPPTRHRSASKSVQRRASL